MKFFNLLKWFSKDDKELDYKNIIYVNCLVDIPREVKQNIFIVSNQQINKWVAFQCPRCRERIEVNLMTSKYPYWTLRIKNRKISLQPSIIEENCNAHFWIRNNKVIEARFG